MFVLLSCGAVTILDFVYTGDSSLIYSAFTGSGLFFVSIILAECIVVSRSYIQARRLEMSALKDQIRPHFVHNALAAIISISRSEPDRSRNLLVNFSTYLRGRFDWNDLEFISIEEELDIIKAYTALEQARFGNRIQIEYQIEIGNFLLPPLILQPLVENALVHGLQGDQAKVEVVVYTRSINKMVRIGVKDNGPGMKDDGISNPGRKGIALANINRRLAQIYGSQLCYLNPAHRGCEVYMDITYREAV